VKRYAMRVDNTQTPIIAALRAIGVSVWIIGSPCDLLTYYRGRWLPMECKTGKKARKDQEKQTAFLMHYNVPRVTTPEQAIEAVSK
jgi:hypothetical protein